MIAELQGKPEESPIISATVPLEIVPKAGRTANGRFSPELAREMGVKARAAWARMKAERIAKAQAPEPQVPPPVEYVQGRIERTRTHIERLDKELAKARDPQSIKWLSDSIAKLQDVERILSGRPAPGNLRPKSPRVPNAGNSTPPAPLD